MHMRPYFWLNGEILQNQSIFNTLTGQNRDMTELKLVWPVNMTGHRSKIILSLADCGRFLLHVHRPLFLTLCVHSFFADDGDASSQ